ncbi:transcription elongation factor A N-terminal and central domain-containing protein [Pygocentrus nattereri]|uniref:transcription elongation factor A N-terminal and central domain-containing protein n=1 Tax=Pygocentrus nattereri TaxID=42514 RepID=UPI0008144C99|nr:transcription elongation factor A N-terminal and central domain-containing protein [Pygocentrus nattereri]
MDTREITRYAMQIEKLHKEGSYDYVSSLLADLSSSAVTLEQLQTTDIAKTVYQLLKSCPATTVQKTAKGLLSKWKRLHGSHEHKNAKGSQMNEHEPPDKGETEIAQSVASEQQVNERETVLCHTVVSQDSNLHSNQLSSEETTLSLQIKECTTSLKAEEGEAAASAPKHTGEENSRTFSVVPPQPRSPTDSPALRRKCTELLLQALTPSQKTDPESTNQLSTIAQAIERHVHAVHGQNQVKYKSCIRSKVANLKNPKNPHLRQGLLTGTLAPEVFAQMSVEEMAGEELQRLREGYTSAAISEHQLPQRLEGTTTTKVRCKRCQGMNCRVTQVPRGTLFLPSWVRSGNADEDAMTFLTCTGCGEQWYHSRWVCL